MSVPYPRVPGFDNDDGTMPENVEFFANNVVGRRILVTRQDGENGTLVLDDGTVVELIGGDDCCAYTYLEEIVQHLPSIDHIVTAVRPSEYYDEWHILADFGEIMTLKVQWSCGNPFYYGYGFWIRVTPPQ